MRAGRRAAAVALVAMVIVTAGVPGAPGTQAAPPGPDVVAASGMDATATLTPGFTTTVVWTPTATVGGATGGTTATASSAGSATPTQSASGSATAVGGRSAAPHSAVSGIPAAPTPYPNDARSPLAPAHHSYEVGAYYFSGWSHGQNDNLTSLLTGRLRSAQPLIGWYDDSQGQVDKNIVQAAGAGIDFFAFDWYDTQASPYATDRTLNEALHYYLLSRQRHRLQFCLNFIDYPPFMPSYKDWPALVNTWISYFKQPGYLRVNGKPLLIIFTPWLMRQIFGSSFGVQLALGYLRYRVKQAGLPGVTIATGAIVALHGNPIPIHELTKEGYDITTGYNYHAMGGEQYLKPVPYDNLVAENRGMCDRVIAKVPLPYIPVVTSGWDQRFSAREQKTAIIYAGRTPAKFTCYAVQARHWVDTHPTRTTKERIILIFAWNEIGEGGSIIPTYRDGYAYTNAVRAVFGGAGHAPTTPSYCR